MNPAKLEKIIKGTVDPGEVFKLIENYGQEFNEIHTVACLRQFATLHRKFTQDMARSLEFDTLLASLECKVGNMDPFLLSSTAWSLGSLSKAHEIGADGLVQSVCTQAKDTIVKFPSRCLGDLVWGLCRLRCKDVALMDAVARRACQICPTFQLFDMSCVAWGFAELEIYDEDLMEAIAQQTISNISSLSLREMGSIAASFTRLNQTHEELSQAMISSLVARSWKDQSRSARDLWFGQARVLLASSKAGVLNTEFLDRVEEQLSKEVLRQCTAYVPAAMLRACTELGCKNRYPKLIRMLKDDAARRGIREADIYHSSFSDAVKWNDWFGREYERRRRGG